MDVEYQNIYQTINFVVGLLLTQLSFLYFVDLSSMQVGRRARNVDI